ncbi:MAG TPA: polysaccharide deacetylase family protein [Planctomycetota bacterium]|nr:polysaccharide deacetylase family protein [Planctomycetota bacterium]
MLKPLLLAATRFCGLQAFARWYNRHRLLVLCYHGVVTADRSEEQYLYRNTVGAREFAAHLDAVTARFHVVTASDVLAWASGRAPLPERALLLTFDDGYRNNLTVAAPLLAERGLSALVSVSTDYIGSDRMLWAMELDLRLRHWSAPTIPLPDGTVVPMPDAAAARDALGATVRQRCKQLPDAQRRRYLSDLFGDRLLPEPARLDDELWRFMTWDEVRALRAAGMEIASHTCSHPILSRLEPADLAHELGASRRRIEQELGAECAMLVYPNGGADDVSPTVLQAVAAAGYRLAFSLTEQRNPRCPEPLAIDRIGIPGHVGMEPFHYRASGLRSLLSLGKPR